MFSDFLFAVLQKPAHLLGTLCIDKPTCKQSEATNRSRKEQENIIPIANGVQCLRLYLQCLWHHLQSSKSWILWQHCALRTFLAEKQSGSKKQKWKRGTKQREQWVKTHSLPAAMSSANVTDGACNKPCCRCWRQLWCWAIGGCSFP